MMELLLKFGTLRRGVCDNCEEEKIVAKVNEVTQFLTLFLRILRSIRGVVTAF